MLAGIALLAVCAWPSNVDKNNKIFYIPMVFMPDATLISLVITIINKFKLTLSAAAAWGDWFLLMLALAMVVLVIILVIGGIQTFVWVYRKNHSQEDKLVEG